MVILSNLQQFVRFIQHQIAKFIKSNLDENDEGHEEEI
jgi:hypothetical protein